MDWGWIGIPDGVAVAEDDAVDVGDGVRGERVAETTAESGGSGSFPAVPGLLEE